MKRTNDSLDAALNIQSNQKWEKKYCVLLGKIIMLTLCLHHNINNKKTLSSQAKTEVTSNDSSLRMRKAKHNWTIIIRSRFRLEYKNVFMHFIRALFKRCYSFRWSSRFCRLPHECILALAWAINLHSLSMNQKKRANESGILYSICEQTLCDIAQSQN